MGAVSGLRVLVVDDEALARERLRQLLADCGVADIHGLEDGRSALGWLEAHPVDVLLLDISMPDLDGMALARQLRQRTLPPALVFTTAHDHFAVEAFELDAADYLLKPVRRERLEQALQKAQARREGKRAAGFTVRQRGRLLHVPLADARYLKAELKYVTLVTPNGEYLLDDALVALEQRLGEEALRIHRNCLVMRHAVQELFRGEGGAEEHWLVRLRDIPTPLPVSRRQIHALRAALSVSD
ncbi:DNA-binding response regulator [Chromobacterium phragmitis]|uniref:DNA-binding response regulator n=1 Tax=Chromobacterium phragmitis TaxID=2202141 RepID=A0A344UJ33_9NEIS|nr:LytTR family DNA-binding domain-containing protein [Chromobacterium phragmitis]AXE29891.1 DNA-binding response regulator [Chromobacterium phragmitis]AXE35281.1 DNA-binding response regulator [Chromobacterium phragmitis]